LVEFFSTLFTNFYRVAALDLSGMGDSGRREEYSAEVRSLELLKVIEGAELGDNVFIIGHSFGGLTATKFTQMHENVVNGLIMADSPIRSPEANANRKVRRMGKKRHYPDYQTAVGRFRLMPEQSCTNEFLVRHIGHHSVIQESEGWTWKFDGNALHNRRFMEPYHNYLSETKCRTALIYGDKSALLDVETINYMTSLMTPGSPVIGIPEAQHHLTLDQPLAFISAVRAILNQWDNDR
jgi:pimeloyl-ACP methyl ester carboxylesterase